MGITIVPTGFEGFGDAVQQGVLAEYKRRTEENKPKSAQEEMLDFIRGQTIKGIREENPQLVEDAIRQDPQTYENITNKMSASPRIASGIQQQGAMQLPPVSGNDILMNKQLGFKSDPMIQRDIAAKIAEKQATNPIDVEGDIAKKSAEYKQKVEESKQTSSYNYGLVVGNLKDYSQRLADAYREGGAGNKFKALRTEQYAEGNIGDFLGKYPKSTGISGKHFEIVAKAFPMITQQIGKEGSVRLIESIFKKFGGTIPQLKTPPDAAIPMQAATIESMFRIQKAFDNIDLSSFDLKGNKKEFVDYVTSTMNNVEFTPEERVILDKTIQEVTAPIEQYLAEQESSKKTPSWSKEKESRYQELLRKRKQ